MVVVDNHNNSYIQSIVDNARVARLATIDFKVAKPHIVPVVFAFDGKFYYIPLDKKPKKETDPKRLRRVRNIQANPNVALLIDEYNENWSKLFFVMVQGKGSLIGNLSEYDDPKRERNSRLDRKSERLHLNEKIDRSHKSRFLLKNAQSLLLQKYPQYQQISMGDFCIMISPEKVSTWKMNSSPVE